MESNNKGTIYQQLNSYFYGVDNTINGNAIQQPQQQKIIIKGNSPEEIRKKGLELQQKQDLLSKFNKTTDRNYQKALQYEAARLPAYMDYEGMEYFPLISSALDLFMEEATTIGSNGKMLNIYSNNERIKVALEDLFYNIIKINVNLPFWTRNLPIKYDSIIPLLNGEEVTIKEISERLINNPNDEIWTYSIQEKTNNILPGKIVWCDLTRKNSEIYKITFDDNTYIETTPDHEFMLRDGSFLRADKLYEGLSLMPFYTIESKETGNIKGYEKVYNPSTNRHIFTHRLVAKECLDNYKVINDKNAHQITHHIDFNKKNNHPSNLIRMSNAEHSEYHCKTGEHGKLILQREDVKANRLKGIDKYLRSEKRKNQLSTKMKNIYPEYFKEYNNSQLHDKHNTIRKNTMTNLWSNDEYKNATKQKMQINFSDECINHITNIIIDSKSYITAKNLSIILLNDNAFMNLYNKENNKIRKQLSKTLYSESIQRKIKRKTNKTYREFYNSIINNNKHEKIINHKVISVELCKDKHDVYCMEVIGKNNEQDRHNFPVCSKNSDGTHTRNGVFVSNCKYGDNFVLLYGERKQGITHVKQMVNYEVERIERIENGKPTTKFKERLTGSEFNIFEIAHFRLLGDDKFIPYGSSILNKVRRVFRQLVMAEDAMLTNRLLRAADRRVFKIDVGNIDEDDVEEYMYKVATKFKKTSQVAPNDGQIDYRFNILGNDEDYFLPLRNGNSMTGIDTLQGSTTLDAIHDIEYLRDNLFIGLGIPKPFLSFQDASGAGKNMAQFDVRFAKKVVRIQQAMIEELNKMAIIHLMLLGFNESDIRDFQLTLTNPSIQHDLLKSELLREQAQTYTELTRGENGIAAMSHTRAKRLVFNMSDVDIVEDLKQQKMEKVVMQELADAPILIKKSGLFADIDKKFGNETALIGAPSGDTSQGGEMPPAGGPMSEPPMSGDMGGAPMPSMGGGGAPSISPAGGGELPPISEQFSDYIHNLVGLKVKENNNNDDISNDVILENEAINNATIKLLKETENIAEPEINIDEINID